MRINYRARSGAALFFATIALVLVTTTGLASAEEGDIRGNWTADGTRDTLPFGEGRTGATFRLAGHVNLDAEIGGESDYWSECIGLTETKNGVTALCVWRSLDGQEIYLELSGSTLSTGSSINGTIVGGTKNAENITGSVNFIWSTMSTYEVNDKVSVGGFAKGLTGTYQLP